MEKMKLKLILLGSLSPLIGLLIFFLQLQVPFHGIKYLVILAIMSAVFLAYFFFCAFFFSSKQHKKNSLYFFVTPFILFLVNFRMDPKICCIGADRIRGIRTISLCSARFDISRRQISLNNEHISFGHLLDRV